MIKVLGDTAVLVELTPRMQPDSFARVQRAALHLRAAAISGVTDIVPALTTVGVHFGPGAHWAAVAKRVRECLERGFAGSEPGLPPAGKRIELPVCYGGGGGMDLEHVATHTGLSKQEVIRRHTAPDYQVQAVGFAPGFPYLSGMDPALSCPRRETPRRRVVAGSVGIGGVQTGIYPQASPGGWQIIGRTPWRLFDAGKASEPSLLRAGDTVRFAPIEAGDFVRLAAEAGTTAREEEPVRLAASAFVEVLHPGLQATVQDLGRIGYQAVGVTEGGAVDRRALRLANLMVGNSSDAAALEWSLQGPRLRFGDRRVCVVMGAIVAGVPFGRPFVVEGGRELDLSRMPVGFRGVLAVSGGLDLPVVLGARATHVRAGFGGLHGRALREGDRLPLGATDVADVTGGWLVSPSLAQPVNGEIPEVRVLRGPEGDAYSLAAWNRLLGEPFRVLSSSDRMGMRLEGAAIEPREPFEMVSQPVVAGTVQVPPDGRPIVLLADRQSLGGYPRIATVISVDLPRMAQVPPGGCVQFVETTLAEAEALRLAEEHDINLFAAAVSGRFVRR